MQMIWLVVKELLTLISRTRQVALARSPQTFWGELETARFTLSRPLSSAEDRRMFHRSILQLRGRIYLRFANREVVTPDLRRPAFLKTS